MILEEQINKIKKEIKELAPHYKMNVEISTIYGDEVDFNTCKKAHVYIQFEDCMVREKPEINSLSKKGHCVQAFVFMNKKESLYQILFRNKVGFIELNSYEQGTQVAFYIKEEGYELEDKIEISTPGVTSCVLTIGEEYFVCYTKYGANVNLFKKRKLNIIKFLRGYGYEVEFEGLDTIDIQTRGHIDSNQQLLNRSDHILISKDKKVLIGAILQKVGKEYGYYDQEYTDKLKLILEETIKEM